MHHLCVFSTTRLPQICELFDIICGTSTGGILAVALGLLRMTTDQAQELYLKLAKDVFGNKRSLITNPSFYRAEPLEKVLQSVCGKTALMSDLSPDAGLPHVCITCMSSVG